MSDHQGKEILFRALRLQTLIRLRWLAVVGQTIAVIVVAFGLDFPLHVTYCMILIGLSAALNVFLHLRNPKARRLLPAAAMMVLCFDILQLTALLFI